MKIDKEQPIIWEGDVEDDCLARWEGLLLRAEWMDDDYWWWCVYDMEKDEIQIEASLLQQISPGNRIHHYIHSKLSIIFCQPSFVSEIVIPFTSVIFIAVQNSYSTIDFNGF